MLNNFHWTNIISFSSSQNNAFEELVCQLAEKEDFKNKQDFIKNGNPDGGVECYIILNNKKEICFQAKWFLSTPQKSQWKQIEKSFKTALEKYPNMIQYYIAIPLDRANPKNSPKLSFMDKWNINTRKWKEFAKLNYKRNINFIYWGSFELFKKLNHKENEDIKNTFFPPILTNNEINYLRENILFNRKFSFKKYKIIDLFAGIGGMRLGFKEVFKEKSSFIFTSEIDKFAQQTYASNYGHLPSGDITQIEPKEIPSFDILLAGFPCQPFSNTRLKKGFDNTRGTLFFDIVQIAKHHKPQVLFLENVKGFINHDKGNTFRVVKETLEELGYRVFAKVLNARDFGVPQNRERIYIIAFLDHAIEFEFPKPLAKSIKLGDILEESVNEKYTISDKLWAGHQRRKLEHKTKGNGFGYCVFNEESEYTSTISARYYKDGSEILIEQKDKNPRKLSPREAGRLQGFPDDFKIVVSDTQAYKQFGNSVAVPVIEALAKNILEVLDK